MILISTHELPTILYTYSVDNFFEKLFDTVLKINQWEHFKNAKKVNLSLVHIDSIINIRFEWENNWKNKENFTAEVACAMHLIWWSRYSRFWKLIFVFLYKFKESENYWSNMLLFITQLNKLYFIYSIRYLKSINELQYFSYSLVNIILKEPFDIILKSINDKIGELSNHGDFENILCSDITQNSKQKNMICRLSAMLEEEISTTCSKEIENIRKKLFESLIDIEHIQSYNDKDDKERNAIWKKWEENINSIGNLMVLEQTINRSISNDPYDQKTLKYSNSNFKIVKKQLENYTDWKLENCILRKESERDKILGYLFPKS